MGFFDFWNKAAPQVIPQPAPRKATPRKSIRDENGEIIPTLDFFQKWASAVAPFEDLLVQNAVRLKSVSDASERIVILQAMVSDFYSMKTLCKQLGPEFSKKFSRSWEHCHNSRNPDFCYIDKYENELNELISKCNQ